MENLILTTQKNSTEQGTSMPCDNQKVDSMKNVCLMIEEKFEESRGAYNVAKLWNGSNISYAISSAQGIDNDYIGYVTATKQDFIDSGFNGVGIDSDTHKDKINAIVDYYARHVVFLLDADCVVKINNKIIMTFGCMELPAMCDEIRKTVTEQYMKKHGIEFTNDLKYFR